MHGMAEIERVLRPGGRVVSSTVPFVWQYNRTILEHRYTGPELAALLAGLGRRRGDRERGPRGVTWATLTGRMLDMLQRPRGRLSRAVLWPLFALGYLITNAIGAIGDRIERRYFRSPLTLPMNLLVTGRRSGGASPGSVRAPAGDEPGGEAT